MAVCVYCRTQLSRQTKPAHVIPSALGGRLKSRMYCCSECNNALSVHELTLAEAMRVFTSMLGVRRGDNRRAASVPMVDTFHGPLAVQGMIPEAVQQAPQHAIGENFVEFTNTAPTLESLARQVVHVLRRTGKTPDDLVAGNDIAWRTEKRSWFASNVEATVTLRQAELHACAKMPFELLALHEPGLALRPELRPTARLILEGASLTVLPDAVTPGPLTRVVRPPLHSCEVWTTGPYIIGKVVLFGGFPTTVPLAHVWQGERFSAVHVIDPVVGRVLINETRFQDGPRPRGWPVRADDPGARAGYVQRLHAHMTDMMKAATLTESRRRVESTWRRELAGRAPHDTDLQRLQELLEEDQKRRARRQDETEPVDPAEVLRLVRAEYDRLGQADSDKGAPSSEQ